MEDVERGDMSYSVDDIIYDGLISKPDMRLTDIYDTIKTEDRANAFEAAGDKTNAARERRRARELGREYREFSEHVGLSVKASRTQTLKSYDKKNIINNITVADIEKANVGSTVSQACIDEIGNALGQDISKYIAEAVKHEAIHATLAYQRNFAQYEALGELLKDIHISGVSKTAYQNGEECLCETAILFERKAEVP